MKYFRIAYKQGKKRGIEVIEANNRLEALKIFSERSLGVMQKVDEIALPLSLRFKKFQEHWDNPIKQQRVKDEPYIALLEQIYVMLDAGMPINVSLQQAINGVEDPMLKAIFQEILDDIERIRLREAVLKINSGGRGGQRCKKRISLFTVT